MTIEQGTEKFGVVSNDFAKALTQNLLDATLQRCLARELLVSNNKFHSWRSRSTTSVWRS